MSLTAEAKNGDTKAMLSLIRRGAKVNSKNEEGITALYWAADRGHYTACKTLIEEGAEINIFNDNGWYPLGIASSYGHSDIVRLLLEKGANPNLKPIDFGAAISQAAFYGHVDIVEMLIARGARVNERGKYNKTPLHSACLNGQINIVKILLKHGADVEALNINKESPSDNAKSIGCDEIVNMIEANTKNSLGRMPLYEASIVGNYKECKKLLHIGALVDSVLYGSCSPLSVAARKGHIEIVRLLLLNGADLKSLSNESNSLYLATKKGHEDIVSLLLEKGANPNFEVNGNTVLHIATQNQNENMVRRLLYHGADLKATNKDGYTPLHCAAISGNESIVLRFIQHNVALVNITSLNLETALHLACQEERSNVVRVLFENGADIQALNSNNEKPLDVLLRKSTERRLIERDIQKLLLPVDDFMSDSQTENPDISKENVSLKINEVISDKKLISDNDDALSDISDGNATVAYISVFDTLERESNRILEPDDLDLLKFKITKITELTFLVNDVAGDLKLLELDREKQKEMVLNLKRKIAKTLHEMETKGVKKGERKKCQDALKEFKRKLEDVVRVKGEMEEDIQKLKKHIMKMKLERHTFHKEVAELF